MSSIPPISPDISGSGATLGSNTAALGLPPPTTSLAATTSTLAATLTSPTGSTPPLGMHQGVVTAVHAGPPPTADVYIGGGTPATLGLAIIGVTPGVGQTVWLLQNGADLMVFASMGGGGNPVGTILAYGGSTPPVSYLLCDGSSFSSVTYPVLATVLGGTTLPDLRGVFPLGAGGSFGAGLGSSGGSSSALLAHSHSHTHGSHSHSHTHGSHSHSHNHGSNLQTNTENTTHSHAGPGGNSFINSGSGGGANITLGGGSYFGSASTNANSQLHTHTITPPTDATAATPGTDATATTPAADATSAGSGSNSMPPYRAVNWIISAG